MGVFFRADQGAILFYAKSGGKGIIYGNGLKSLYRWIKSDEEDDYINILIKSDILNSSHKNMLFGLLKECTSIKAPYNSLSLPEQIQVELTTRCPLRCPQCFCDLTGQDIDKEILFSFLQKAAWLKIPYISFSGGEPLVYPHLTESIKYSSDLGLYTALATSGAGLDRDYLEKIMNAGLSELFISLNGSTEKINSRSRDGYDETILAMKLLKNTDTPYFINWVAREDNVDDLPDLASFCRDHGARGIIILVLKPDSKSDMKECLRNDSFLKIADFLRVHDHSTIRIQAESCFSAMHSHLAGNKPESLAGCEAGRTVMSLNADGSFSPCRHIPFREKYEGIRDYWYDSKILDEIRKAITNLGEPCSNCKFGPTCIPCRGNSYKLYKDPCAGDQSCMAFTQ